MGLKINQSLVNEQTGNTLVKLCPFGAISYENGQLEINAGCKNCRMCVRKGPAGVVTYEEDQLAGVDKSQYRGVCVYADIDHGIIHPVTLELIGKARELASVINHPVYVLAIGADLKDNVEELLSYGPDQVFVYEHEQLKNFDLERYTNCFENFIQTFKPSSILVGATNAGRSLAPRVAARFHTGLTADCTVLDMKENTDLVQIRPAFGGNIMAQIITTNTRPQFATVRYKVFNAPEKQAEVTGTATYLPIQDRWLVSHTEVLEVTEKPKEIDISEADVIVAVGRGVKSRDDLALAEELASLLGGVVACTRPMVESGLFNSRHQIGLSGKTVKPKLIITLGVSGAVQFAAGMKGSDTIIAINSDPNAPIFDIANYGLVGDLYTIVPQLIRRIKEGK